MTERVALAIGVVWTTVAVRWLFVSSVQADLHQSEVARTQVAVGLVSVGLGVLGGLLAVAIGRFRQGRAVAVAVPFSLVLFLEVLSNVRTDAVVSTLAVAVACAGLAYAIVVRLLTRFPALAMSPGSWMALAGSASGFALMLTVVSVTDATGKVLALAGTVVIILLLFGYWAGGQRSVLLPTVSLLVVLLSSALLADRIPVMEPTALMSVKRPSVLLITVDTLRADHVGAYGYDDARTDYLDALAAEGITFLQTVSPNVFTGPSHASILTGLLPENHGVLVNKMKLAEEVPTLAGLLQEEGYTTAAFVSGYTTQDKACGLPSRFLVHNDDIRAFQWLPQVAYGVAALRMVKEASDAMGWYTGEIGQGYRMGSVTADLASAWIDAHAGWPYFVWTHFFDPHVPYRPPEQYIRRPLDSDADAVSGKWYVLNAAQRSDIVSSPEKVAQMIALYDAEIAYVDDQIGRVVDAARRAAPDGELLVVVTSDHGEAMGEHGMYWFRDLYDPTLMVPLIIVPPTRLGLDSGKVDTQVRLIDIVPTILELLDIPTSDPFDGRSLVPLIRGESEEEPGPAISGLYSERVEFARERHSVRDQGWKLIWNRSGWDGGGATRLKGASRELYDLQADPSEVDNLWDSGEAVQEELAATLDAVARPEGAVDLNLTPEERERLRSLGYLQ